MSENILFRKLKYKPVDWDDVPMGSKTFDVVYRNRSEINADPYSKISYYGFSVISGHGDIINGLDFVFFSAKPGVTQSSSEGWKYLYIFPKGTMAIERIRIAEEFLRILK
jgi:hypothetical protein